MLIGYARVSTKEQHEALQLDALQKAGCKEIFVDKITGSTFERKELTAALAYVREGDTFVVWKLDRLGRSLPHLIETVNELHKRKIDFKSITENIDTTTPGGKLVFHFFGAIAEFERDLIRERTKAGLDAARARGKVGGRRHKLTPQQVRHLQALYNDTTNDIKDILNTFHIGRTTMYRYVGKGKRGVKKA